MITLTKLPKFSTLVSLLAQHSKIKLMVINVYLCRFTEVEGISYKLFLEMDKLKVNGNIV